MFHAQHITIIVKWLAFGALSVDLALVVFILFRRAVRNRFYLQKDAAQKRFSEILARYFAGNLTVESTRQLLKIAGGAEREAAKTLLVAGINAKTRKKTTELLAALGFVREWVEQAFGRRRGEELLRSIIRGEELLPVRDTRESKPRRLRRLRLFSISRAVAVGRLGRLSPEFSSVLMRAALRDPSPYVGRLAVASLGRNQTPNGVPVLLEELRRSIDGETELPIRSIKTALVRYPVENLRHFTPFMYHGSPRFRFLAVDTIREMCGKAPVPWAGCAEFPPELRLWFLERAVRDDSADVRARSAGVIRYFRCPEATEALRLLSRDENEFVRLHSVRACADPYYSELIGDILQRITDERWRVREAAVRTVASFRSSGRQRLERFFLDTSDRYASEQIGNELQRSGMALQVVSALGSPDREGIQAGSVCTKLVHLGMVSLLVEALDREESSDVRTQLFEVLSTSKAPQFAAVLRRIAANEADPLKSKAKMLLLFREDEAAMAVGEQN